MRKFFVAAIVQWFLIMTYLTAPRSACCKETAAFQFLKLPFSARLASLGSVNFFGPSDGTMAWSNPSSAVLVHQSEVAAGGISHLGGVANFVNASALFKKEGRAYGFCISYSGAEHSQVSAPILDKNYLYQESGRFLTYNLVLGGFYSVMIQPRTSFGVSTKVVAERLYSATYFGRVIDLALTEIVDKTSFFSIGARNLGGAFNPSNFAPSSVFLTIFKKINVVGFVLEAEQDIINNGEVKVGLEAPVEKILAIRAGFRHPFREHDTGDFVMSRVTFGLGLTFGKIKFDYGYYPKGELGANHYINIGVAKK